MRASGRKSSFEGASVLDRLSPFRSWTPSSIDIVELLVANGNWLVGDDGRYVDAGSIANYGFETPSANR